MKYTNHYFISSLIYVKLLSTMRRHISRYQYFIWWQQVGIRPHTCIENHHTELNNPLNDISLHFCADPLYKDVNHKGCIQVCLCILPVSIHCASEHTSQKCARPGGQLPFRNGCISQLLKKNIIARKNIIHIYTYIRT